MDIIEESLNIAFWVHEDRASKTQSKIHRAECLYCNHGKGTRADATDVFRTWHGVNTYAEAVDLLIRLGYNSRDCLWCQPNG